MYTHCGCDSTSLLKVTLGNLCHYSATRRQRRERGNWEVKVDANTLMDRLFGRFIVSAWLCSPCVRLRPLWEAFTDVHVCGFYSLTENKKFPCSHDLKLYPTVMHVNEE